MMLYFNACYFPAWCLAEGMMLQLKYHLLPGHYQFLLVTTFLILLLVEGSRLYLGYLGNLQEKVSTTSALASSPLFLVRGGVAVALLDGPSLRTRAPITTHSSWSPVWSHPGREA
ncbi:transmembrane protein 17-like [Pezoporus wallicus]|uniref:transmembrane protein 17-like n=1 Tax=Pezoporus wallicus TaxID=35540 RepID=UPI00255024F4|nr:transmembrane protein 17-like [Pezoporus wallicus]